MRISSKTPLATALIATALTLASATASMATELQPASARSVDLGAYRGSAYYTVENGRYRVVATLASVNSGSDQPQVIRLVTTLNPEQTVHLSVPGTLGSDGRETTIAFSRNGDRVDVASADATAY
ncbi:hypothetical protein [Methylobacterium sp. 77]|uniref:hypothetical protein n=1 Tax=Methylobacterium sp. 77 TaxID=1101192 RepID=UPI000378AF29|nr:hypothetical protein [Methylobacterium sp. 77]